MSPLELLSMFAHFMLLSMLSVGGAISIAPEMHRYLVLDHSWITDAQFNASIAIAQAAPGPNVLFVALMGWSAAGALGALATMGGMLLPSSMVALAVSRYGRMRPDSRLLRAASKGLAPLTLGLLSATAWLLAGPAQDHMMMMGLAVGTVIGTVRFKWSPIAMIAIGALAGVLGRT